MTDGYVDLLYNSSWKFHQLAAGQLLSGQPVGYRKGRWFGPSITYKITPVGSLSSSQPGGPLCWAISLAFGILGLKGTVSRDFRLLFFSWISSPKPLSIPLGLFQIFSKIRGDICSSRWTTGVVDTGGKWRKSSITTFLIILFGHLWEVELTYM